MLQAQAAADAQYFGKPAAGSLTPDEQQTVATSVLAAYRWQYIVSGVQEPRFRDVLGGLITSAQHERIAAALMPICS